jgi:hypothetical protein
MFSITPPRSVLMAGGPLRLTPILLAGLFPLLTAAMTSMTAMPTVSEEVRGDKDHENHDPETVLR